MPNIIEKYYNELKNLESYFKCAVKANYIRNLYRTDIDLLLKFYEEYYNKKFIGNPYSCSRCAYNLTKQIGELFLNYDSNKKSTNSGNTEQPKRRTAKRQIKDNLISKYNISESTVDKDFMEANKLLSEQMDLTAEAYKYLLNARLENIYSKAILKNDLKSALGVVQQQMKLNGLGIEKQSIDLNDNTFEIKLN